jgi:hypothetical protein
VTSSGYFECRSLAAARKVEWNKLFVYGESVGLGVEQQEATFRQLFIDSTRLWGPGDVTEKKANFILRLFGGVFPELDDADKRSIPATCGLIGLTPIDRLAGSLIERGLSLPKAEIQEEGRKV